MSLEYFCEVGRLPTKLPNTLIQNPSFWFTFELDIFSHFFYFHFSFVSFPSPTSFSFFSTFSLSPFFSFSPHPPLCSSPPIPFLPPFPFSLTLCISFCHSSKHYNAFSLEWHHSNSSKKWDSHTCTICWEYSIIRQLKMVSVLCILYVIFSFQENGWDWYNNL